MLCAGDEFGRTQRGNNNAYCQDNKVSWLNWDFDDEQKELRDFVRMLIRLRAGQPVLRRRQFFQGRPIRGSQVKDISWLEPSGQEMTDASWNAEFVRCLGMLLAGDQIDETDERGNRIVGDSLLLLLNAHHEPILFTLPQHTQGWWDLVLDTAHGTADDLLHHVGQAYELAERSLAVFRFCEQGEASD